MLLTSTLGLFSHEVVSERFHNGQNENGMNYKNSQKLRPDDNSLLIKHKIKHIPKKYILFYSLNRFLFLTGVLSLQDVFLRKIFYYL